MEAPDQRPLCLLFAAAQAFQEFRLIELGLTHDGLPRGAGACLLGECWGSVTYRPVPSLTDSPASSREAPSMPTCRDMSELVTDYLERAVALRTRLDMWWHLCRCESCRRYYDQMRHTVRLLGSRPPAASDQKAEEGVLAAARDRRPYDP